MRRIVHLPGGTSHVSSPSLSSFAVKVTNVFGPIASSVGRRQANGPERVKPPNQPNSRLGRQCRECGRRRPAWGRPSRRCPRSSSPPSAAARVSPRIAAALRPAFSVQTIFCIDSSGLIHGPPLPFQPASLFMFTSMPSRAASEQDVLEQFAPLRAGERHGPDAGALIDFHNQHAADARRLHRLQIGGDALAGEIAVQPEPVDPGLGRLRRTDELRGTDRRPSLARPPPTRRRTSNIPAIASSGARNTS